jgi:hypothetical protein
MALLITIWQQCGGAVPQTRDMTDIRAAQYRYQHRAVHRPEIKCSTRVYKRFCVHPCHSMSTIDLSIYPALSGSIRFLLLVPPTYPDQI